MRELINNFFGSKGTKSKDEAKQRLKILLVHDQLDLSPTQIDQMKDEIIAVISKYADINHDKVEFRLNREQGSVNIESSVPVIRRTA